MPDSLADLARVELFSEFDDALLRHLADRSFVRRLAKGQVLFTEGRTLRARRGPPASTRWRPLTSMHPAPTAVYHLAPRVA
jgi:hypothetical protein